MSIGILHLIPRVQPPPIVHEDNRSPRQHLWREIQNPPFCRRSQQDAFQLRQRLGRLLTQRRDNILPKPELGRIVVGVNRQQIAHDLHLSLRLDKFGRNGDAIVRCKQPLPRKRGQQRQQLINVQHGQSASTTLVWLENLQCEESWRLGFIAAICMPGKLFRCLRTRLMVITLEGVGGGTDIPHPAAVGRMGEWEAVGVGLVEI